jgi:class 3 adenylate cyclase
MSQLPSGTVTFVFSDIEGSTSLLKQLGDDGYAQALATHRRLVRDTFAANAGEEIDTQGDAFFYSFDRARAAVTAAVAVQRAHAEEAWPSGVHVRIRLGLHTGEPVVGNDGYTGLDVVRAARIAATARGGQVLLSEATSALVASHLPEGVTLEPAGRRQLKDIDEPETVFELVIPGVSVTPAAEEVAPPTSTALPPGLLDEMPPWLQGFTERLLPSTSRAIEERVLAKIDEARAEAERAEVRSKRKAGPPPSLEPFAEPPPATPKRTSRSIADEISRLQTLRESGALTEDQYQRAVEQALGNDH